MTVPSPPLPPPPPVRWGRLLLILAGIVAVPVIAVQCGSARAKYVAFSERREAWHQRCDRFVDTPLSDPRAKACKVELDELVAEAKREGWSK